MVKCLLTKAEKEKWDKILDNMDICLFDTPPFHDCFVKCVSKKQYESIQGNKKTNNPKESDTLLEYCTIIRDERGYYLVNSKDTSIFIKNETLTKIEAKGIKKVPKYYLFAHHKYHDVYRSLFKKTALKFIVYSVKSLDSCKNKVFVDSLNSETYLEQDVIKCIEAKVLNEFESSFSFSKISIFGKKYLMQNVGYFGKISLYKPSFISLKK